MNGPTAATATTAARRARLDEAREGPTAREARHQFLLELSDRLRPLADPVAVQREAARAVGVHLGAIRVGYAEILADGETAVVTVNYIDGVGGIEGRYRVSDYSPAQLRALLAGKPVARGDVAGSVAGDAAMSDAERAAHAALEIGATIDLPLLKDGRLVAILFVHFRGPHDFTTEEVALLEAVAERTWDAVERARAGAALRASEGRLRLALDVAELGTWSFSLVDGSGYLDERAAQIVGLPAGEFADVAQAQVDGTHPEDLAAMQAAVAAGIASGAPFDLAYRVVHPDGSVRHVASRAAALTDEAGRPVRLVGSNRDVTAQREAEARLRESEARYRTLFNSILEGFCVIEVLFEESDASGPPRPVDYVFLEANPAFVAQTGLANAIGRRMRELAPAHEQHWFEIYGRVALTGEPARFEAPAEALGRWYSVDAFRVGQPHERRVAILFDDITGRKRAEAERERLAAEVAAERERLRTVVLQTPAPLALLVGPEHRYALVNDAYKRLSGGGRDVTGLTPREAFPELEGSGILELFDRVYETGESWEGVETPVRYDRDGTGVIDAWFDLRFEPVRDADGSVRALFNFAVDVTSQVLARREAERLLDLEQRARARVEDAYREAEGARAEAEAANRAKSEFLAVMSHELRTPLNAIGGYAELMEMGIRGPVTPHQREDLRRLQASQRHLLGLINEVLNYAKLETGTVHYDVASVPVREAIAGAEALVAPQAQLKGLALTAGAVSPELRMRADAEKLRQILVNLLSNAVKFTDRGGRVELAALDAGDRVHVTVRDTGIGIAADQLERIFDPFVQVRSDLTRTAEGTGLGLAISRDLARGMGGDLTVESAPGTGSTFTLTLPRG
ncbi:MAG: ATP-binding protein [Gemmatimonadaceae bacterium]